MAFAALCIGLSVPALVVVVWRFVAPPLTPFMLLRRVTAGTGWDYRWMPLSAMSPEIARAVIAAEDTRFLQHHGFDWTEMESALEAQRRGRRLRGARLDRWRVISDATTARLADRKEAMRETTSGLAQGLATLGGALLTLGRSYGRFDWETGEDERHTARTADGWNLALYRYRPVGAPQPFPVLCGHGMAGSHFIFDLDPRYSLARYLAQRGFDTWLVDFRGRGDSWPDGGPAPHLQWNFDDFVAHDLPTSVQRVCEIAGADQAFWLGMEMSGQALYAAAIAGSARRVRGAVTCGSPVLTSAGALVPGVTSAPKARRHGRVPFRGGSRLAGPVLAYGGFGVLESSFRRCNSDPLAVSRYFRNGIPDEATDLVEQFSTWIRDNVMRSRDGAVTYSARLSEVRLPLLVIAAAHDLQRPPAGVRAAFEAFGSSDKTFLLAGVADGFSVDFGHDDLLAGVASPAEVFPRIAGWLAARGSGGDQ